MTNPSSRLLLSFLLFYFSISSASPAPAPAPAADPSVYENFLHCFTNYTKSDTVSNLVYAQTNDSYTAVLRAYIRNARFNTSSTIKPLVIITPTEESHVQGAVICTKSVGMQLKIRSGGHDYDGISYINDSPFFILDMFNLRDVEVNVRTETAKIQAGATLGEVYYGIWNASKVHGFPAGICPTVGVGGHVSGGGYGNLIRKYGLSADYIIDAQIVDAEGRLLDRKSMGKDLFWAISGGGGGSFGVIISFTVKIVRVPEKVTVFRVEKRLDVLEDNMTGIVILWQEIAPKIDNDLFMRMLVQPVSSTVHKGNLTMRITIVAEFLGNVNRLISIMDKDFPELGLKKENCTEMSWIQSVLWWDDSDLVRAPEALLDRNTDSATFLKRKSDYVKTPIGKDGLEWIWKKMIEIGRPGLVFNSYGGKMNDVPADATPMPHRKGNLFKIQYSTSWSTPDLETERMAQIRRLYSYMTPFVSKNPRSSYLNYRDVDIGISHNGNNMTAEGRVFGEKYFGINYDRLVKVKTQVDPHNFFRNEQSIPPLTSKR